MHRGYVGGPEMERTIGLLLHTVSDPQEAALWAGAVEAARASGVSLICFECGTDDERSGGICSLVKADGLDGLIAGLDLGSTDLAEAFPGTASLPVVHLAGDSHVPGHVTIDYGEGMRVALRHLVDEHSRERIAFVRRQAGTRADRQRYQAYVSVLRERGMTYDADLVLLAEEGGLSAERIAHALFAEGASAPDAIIVSADAMGLELITALRGRGVHVPQDVAVVGLGDGAGAASASTALTTLTQPWSEMGGRAVNALEARWRGGEMPGSVALSGRLFVGISCGCEARHVVSGAPDGPVPDQWAPHQPGLVRMPRRVVRRLGSASSFEELSRSMAEELPALGIPRAYVALSERWYARSASMRLVAAHDVDGGPAESVAAQPIGAGEFLPADVRLGQRPLQLLVQPLWARGREIGHVVSGAGTAPGELYGHLSSSLGAIVDALALEQQMTRDARHLGAVAQLARIGADSADPQAMMQEVADLVLEQLELYFVGLYLLDQSGRWAVLHTGTGQAAREMLARGHRLEVCDASLVGQCIAHGTGRTARYPDGGGPHGGSPWLPYTCLQVVLPLRSSGRPIGVLDLHSALPVTIGERDIEALQLMADQLAGALETSRAFAELRARLTREAALRQLAEQIRGAGDRIALLDAAERAVGDLLDAPVRIVPVSEASGCPAAGFPIEVEGVTTGVLNVGTEPGHALTAAERGLAQAACAQVGEALSRLRLRERTATQASRERVISEIVRKLEQAPDLESLMRTTADELARVLHASRAYVRLGTEDELFGS